MSKKIIPPEVDYWAQAHFKTLIQSAQSTHDHQGHHLTSVRARDFERAIHNIIMPLLLAIGTQAATLQYEEYKRMREKLHDVALRGDPERFADYPPDQGKQLILDRLDTVEAMLRALVKTSKVNYVEIDADTQNIFVDFRTRQERKAA